MASFDYVVVGGGSAGCVIAARLSEDPDTRVLLLEAGPVEPVPEMADPTLWWQLVESPLDWNYETVPQTALDEAVLRVPQGKVLGGSSGINGMIFIRGDRYSFDAWERAGALGWNYDTLLPYFKRSERAPGRNPVYRGMDGPIPVSPQMLGDPLFEACFKAMIEVGYPFNYDCNAESSEGVSFHDFNIFEGKRVSVADAYLRPAMSRPNLIVLGGALAGRLILENGTICRGVEYRVGGQVFEALADREVIVTAGAIPTPKLLLLSGIGPASDLRSVGIEVNVDLPGVGENFHDHVKSQVSYTATRPVHVSEATLKPHAMLRSDPSVQGPDLHILFPDFAVRPRFTPLPEPGYSVVFGLLTPHSRGHVRLASANPDQAPIVDPNLLDDPRDLERLLAGLQIAREIGSADALAALRKAEVFPGPGMTNNAEYRSYIRNTATSYTHLVGTCKMGTDMMAVVDPQLKVYGVKNLRIADASVMPTVPAANTHPAVLAVAERAADIIKQR
ncbi:choline dehydrogenase [Actinoplanes sp. TBRC 11911]|uniref:GMC family oxidoreductase n=1 Tax=Actinoplanes sp. TBRC 11911 TaxID=2729386 RepID=UPI00145F4241|nr:GMC family oxidoreductase N-terminal domain-containing protein [Actinoplanes sp. TBRC 11911]NMO57857.1 choline dehydrogenase [Actinoplanes sp. TBRC 11911]